MMLIQIVVSITFFGGLLLLAYKAVKPVVISVKNRVHYLFGFRVVHINTLDQWAKMYRDLEGEISRLQKEYAPVIVDKEDKGVVVTTVGKGKKRHTVEHRVYQTCFTPASNGHDTVEQHVRVQLRNGKYLFVPRSETGFSES